MIRLFFTLVVCSVAFAGDLFALTLDGRLDDPEWTEAHSYSDFVAVDPFTLEPADFYTEAKIFSNEAGIYIGIVNQQPKATHKSERSARDAEIFADRNTIIIDFDNTAIAGYQFEVGNGGSLRDGIWRNETSFTNEWDGIWSAQTSSDDDHWYTEVFIPWDVAPMVGVENGKRAIGLHLTRYVAANSKLYASAPIDESRQRFLSEFETATIPDFSSSSIQVFAYVSARQDRVAEKEFYNTGVDVFWKPSTSKQLSLTVNPDFGQVEADDLVVNFSPLETFFSENRPFFTENQAIFDIRGNKELRVLHTRRIGGPPDSGDEAGTDIIGAVKFTSVNDGISYGFFSAIEDSDSNSQGRDYYVGRALRKTDNYSLGYMLTYTDRPDINREATVHATDYSYNFGRNVKITGQVVHSDVDTATENFSDVGGGFVLSHQVTDTWSQQLEVSHYGDEFEVNDAGFLERNNLKSAVYSTSKQLFNFTRDNPFQQLEFDLNLDYAENTEGEKLNSFLQLGSDYTLKNTGDGSTWIRFHSGGIDDLITRGNGDLNTDSGTRLFFIYFADRRKRFQWHVRASRYDETVSGDGYDFHIHPSYQFNDQYLLKLGFTYTDSKDWLIWQNGAQLNAYDQKRLFTEIDLTANLSESQEFAIKFEWIALRGLGQQAYLVNSAGNLNELNMSVEDFNLSIVGLQLRYRYEIAPLSNLFVVYSRGGTAALDENRSFSSLFSPGWDARDGDNFIVKVRYQF